MGKREVPGEWEWVRPAFAATIEGPLTARVIGMPVVSSSRNFGAGDDLFVILPRPSQGCPVKCYLRLWSVRVKTSEFRAKLIGA